MTCWETLRTAYEFHMRCISSNALIEHYLQQISAEVDTEAIDTEPIETEPIDTEPIDAEPIDEEAIDEEAVDTEPIDTETIETEAIVEECSEVKVEDFDTETVPEPVVEHPVFELIRSDEHEGSYVLVKCEPEEPAGIESCENGSPRVRRGPGKTKNLEYEHVCWVCGRRFREKRGLDGHMRRHLDDKPFVCR